MKLYYVPGACSLAVHIVLREAGYKFDMERVDMPNKKTESGADYLSINPKGYVPALQLDDGAVLTEAAVMLQYLADEKPRRNLAPKPRTMERYRLMEWLNFTAAEIHKTLGAFFRFKQEMTPEWRQAQLGLVEQRFATLEKMLGSTQYVMGDEFSIADAYLFTTLNFANFLQIDLARWPAIQAYMARVAGRPAVRKAMKTEGLAK
jgi:glutathione S-transferase